MAPKGGKGGGSRTSSGSSSSSSSSSSCGSGAFRTWYSIWSLVVIALQLLAFITVYSIHNKKKKRTPLIKGPLGGFAYPGALFLFIVGLILGITAIVMRECDGSSSVYRSPASANIGLAYGVLYTAGLLILLAVIMIPLTVAVLHRAQKSPKDIKLTKIAHYTFLAVLSILWITQTALHASYVTNGLVSSPYIILQLTYDCLFLVAAATVSGGLIAALLKIKKHNFAPKTIGVWIPILTSFLLSEALLALIQDLGYFVQFNYSSNDPKATSMAFLTLDSVFVAVLVVAVLYAAAALNWSDADEAAAKEKRLGRQHTAGAFGIGHIGKPFDGSSSSNGGISLMPQQSVPAHAYVVTPQQQSWNGRYQSVPQSDGFSSQHQQQHQFVAQNNGPAPVQSPVQLPTSPEPQHQHQHQQQQQQQQRLSQGWGAASYQPVPQQQEQFQYFNQNTAYQPTAQQQHQQSPVYQQPQQQQGWQQQNVYHQAPAEQYHPGLRGSPVQGQGYVVR